MNNDKKNTNLKTDIIGFTAFGLVILLGILFTLWPSLPKTKTEFVSYEEFKQHINDDDNFPDELPSTASDVNYYRYYNGFGKFGCGVSFTLNQEEFDAIKKEYNDMLLKQCENERKSYETVYENEPLQDKFEKNRSNTFWKYLASEEMNEYNILRYIKGQNGSFILDAGVFVNEKTKRVIIFSYQQGYH